MAIAAWNTLSTPPLHMEEAVERVARAICEASGETWKEGAYEVMSGPNWEMEDHPLDPFNNHWRHKARAAIEALSATPCGEQVERLREALTKAERALTPIADRVFNDNGDMTISTAPFEEGVFVDAYFAWKKARAALSTPSQAITDEKMGPDQSPLEGGLS